MKDKEMPTLVTSRELQEFLKCCRQTAEKFGDSCGAKRYVGRKRLYDLDVVCKAIQAKNQS